MHRVALDKLISRKQHQRAEHEAEMLRLTTEVRHLVAERRHLYGICEHGVAFEECWGCRIVEACEMIQKHRGERQNA